MQQRPGRTILTMLSIVIGVTAAVAVGLGTATTRNAYKQMFALVTGRSTLEVDATGGGAFEADVFDKVAAVSGVAAATPLIERPTSMSLEDGERRVRMQILGIDPQRDSSVRDYTIVAGRQVKEGDELVLDEGFAQYLGLKVGDEVKLLTRRLSKPFTIVGLLRSQAGAAIAQTAMAFLPIQRAQFHFNARGQANSIDKIQIVTAANLDPDAVLPQVAAELPDGVQVHRPAASTQLMRETLLSSEQGLTLATRFSLLMATFIILNTFLMNVSERRRHLSIMRAIGATKKQIKNSLLAEALILGAIGTALGMLLGVLLAYVGTTLIARAFDVQLPKLSEVMTPRPFVLGATFGLSLAYVGARLPARLATGISPLEGMNRAVEEKSRSYTLLLLIGGLFLILLGLAGILGSIYRLLPIETGSDVGLIMLIGLVMINGAMLTPQATFVATVLRPMFPVEARLALKQVLRHQVRSTLTVGVLFVAGSTGVGMANSILDCVRDVRDWYKQAIVGDYFVRAMMPDMATGTAADLPEELGTELETLHHVQSLDGIAFVEGKVPRETGDALTAIVIARKYVDPQPAFDLVSGNRERIGDQIRSGEVVIGSVLAQKLGLKVGDKLSLETRAGVKQLPICGVANEYMVGGLAIHIHRDLAARWLGVEGVDGYIIKAEQGFREALQPELVRICHKYDVFLLSQGDIRQNVDRIVGGTEWSLWLLVYMGFVVAAFGIVNTLTMNVLEQTRELGLLRIVAMTKSQVRRTVEAQALIIGGIGLPQGIAMGVAIAYLLNLGMMPSFGHPIDFHLYPAMLVVVSIGAVIIVLGASVIPARRATRLNLVDALHYE
jgi:putative ABC transport system permease protein